MFKEKWKYQNLHEIKDSCLLGKQAILMCASDFSQFKNNL